MFSIFFLTDRGTSEIYPYGPSRSLPDALPFSLRGLGFTPFGFVPPAWLMRREGHLAVGDAGLRFSEDERVVYLFPAGRRLPSPAVRWRDRKSTRLNSSH